MSNLVIYCIQYSEQSKAAHAAYVYGYGNVAKGGTDV